MPDAPDATVMVQDIDEACTRQPIALAPHIDHRPVTVAAESNARERHDAAAIGKRTAKALPSGPVQTKEARLCGISEQVKRAPSKRERLDT